MDILWASIKIKESHTLAKYLSKKEKNTKKEKIEKLDFSLFIANNLVKIKDLALWSIEKIINICNDHFTNYNTNLIPDFH